MKKKMWTPHHMSQARNPDNCKDPIWDNRLGSPNNGHQGIETGASLTKTHGSSGTSIAGKVRDII
jgi:hypothetical protein